ncbi:MAG: TIGR01777 family oxidoreductase [Saprospiraceae bacterium]
MAIILIGGGTGLIGQRLSEMLTERKHTVRLLSRSPEKIKKYTAFKWDLATSEIDEGALEGVDGIINLAGAGIADKAWTAKRKQLIIDSRVKGNELLVEILKKKNQQVEAFISSSAIGYYGDRGSEKLPEAAAPGNDGFLSESCILWEGSAKTAAPVCERLVIVRTGVVLSTKGGALEKMLLPFKFGMGNYFGDGTAYMPWIHIDDICRIFIKAVEDKMMQGIFNGVAPESATGREMAFAIKEARDSFALVTGVPEFALKIAMGERVTMLTNSTRVVPERTIEHGFKYLHSDLVPALEDLFENKK